MKKTTAMILCGGAIYIAMAITALLVGMRRFTPPDVVGHGLTLAGPCAFLLWGPHATLWFAVSSAVLWSAIVMTARADKNWTIWLAMSCLTWAGSAFLSYCFSI